MAGRIHEMVISSVVTELILQLRSISCGQTASATFARHIKSCNHTTLKFPQYSTHAPDGQFQHLQARWPGLVIEISHSQKRHDLPRLADDYILGSNGNIRVVLGIDIDYGGSKEVTLSVWRPKFISNDAGKQVLVVEQTVKNEVIRDKDGSPNDSGGAGIHFVLQEFGPDALSSHAPLCDQIVVSASTLCEHLQDAENLEAMMEEDGGVATTGACEGTLPREDTPPDQLLPEDEERFQRAEDKAAQVAETKDLSFNRIEMKSP
jgi:hypothetical protein